MAKRQPVQTTRRAAAPRFYGSPGRCGDCRTTKRPVACYTHGQPGEPLRRLWRCGRCVMLDLVDRVDNVPWEHREWYHGVDERADYLRESDIGKRLRG